MLERGFYEKLEDIMSELASEELNKKANELISISSFEANGADKNLDEILNLIQKEITPELRRILEVFFVTQSEDGISLLEHCLNHIYINTISMVLSDLRSRLDLGLEPHRVEFTEEFFKKAFDSLRKKSGYHLDIVRKAFESEDDEI